MTKLKEEESWVPDDITPLALLPPDFLLCEMRSFAHCLSHFYLDILLYKVTLTDGT